MTKGELLNHPALAGLTLRGCAAHDKWEDSKPDIACLREVAHAHLGGSRRNWVCLRSPSELTHTTLSHEIAHLLAGHKIHNERWRRLMRSLGGRVEERYKASHRGG